MKYATDGNGIIVRLRNPSSHEGKAVLTARTFQPKAAFLCDALERDKEAVEVKGNTVVLPSDNYFTSIRMIVEGTLT